MSNFLALIGSLACIFGLGELWDVSNDETLEKTKALKATQFQNKTSSQMKTSHSIARFGTKWHFQPHIDISWEEPSNQLFGGFPVNLPESIGYCRSGRLKRSLLKRNTLTRQSIHPSGRSHNEGNMSIFDKCNIEYKHILLHEGSHYPQIGCFFCSCCKGTGEINTESNDLCCKFSYRSILFLFVL